MAETSPRDDPNGCFWTGCYFSGCPTGYREVSREECFFIHSKHCCPAVTCPAPTPPAGWEVDDDCRLFYNKDADTCPVQCGPGMAGDPSARCNVHGKWVFKGTCTAGLAARAIDFPSFLLHALRSNAAYCTPQEVESGLFAADLPVFDNRSQSRTFVAGDSPLFVDRWADGTQWIAIRGTQTPSDLNEDMHSALVLHKLLGMRLHLGFLQRSVAALSSLRRILDPTKPIRITGHSLGGSIATIVGLFLQKHGYNVVDVVTFGAPKVTNLHGTQKVDRLPVLRITLPDDPIPAFPPMKAYRQAGPEVILHNTSLEYDYLTAAQATFHNKRSGHFFGTLLSVMENHPMLQYLIQIYLRQPAGDPVLEAALEELVSQPQGP
eukprot:GGOE01030967.1.p1 GENE.GGOE01030967.1~~GGOE01030967.1.p1  ORF type:complete len:406 (+),score=102.37 GGOE01030967.1:87-1220(+)